MTAQKGPAWGYKLEDGEVVGKVFPDGKLPRGWKDSPAGLEK
jgi:hypothetical protein